MKQALYYAWFSKKCAENGGYTVWMDELGNEVFATEVRRVTKNSEPVSTSKWSDNQYVGIVVEFARSYKGMLSRCTRKYLGGKHHY